MKTIIFALDFAIIVVGMDSISWISILEWSSQLPEIQFYSEYGNDFFAFTSPFGSKAAVLNTDFSHGRISLTGHSLVDIFTGFK